jgi:hypothetical protein
VSDWIKHDGGPQPVADDVWVGRLDGGFGLAGFMPSWNWSKSTSYRILNQHLIDAARIEGIRLGLEAANKAIEALVSTGDLHIEEEMALEEASIAICTLNSEAIAKETAR